MTLKVFDETFPGSVALLKFLDGTFIVVYPQGTHCLHLRDTIPTTFGGLLVSRATDNIAPAWIQTRLYHVLTPETIERAAPFVESGDQGLSKGPQKVKLYPGSRLMLQGPLFGQQPATSKTRRENLFQPSPGLLVCLDIRLPVSMITPVISLENRSCVVTNHRFKRASART